MEWNPSGLWLIVTGTVLSLSYLDFASTTKVIWIIRSLAAVQLYFAWGIWFASWPWGTTLVRAIDGITVVLVLNVLVCARVDTTVTDTTTIEPISAEDALVVATDFLYRFGDGQFVDSIEAHRDASHQWRITIRDQFTEAVTGWLNVDADGAYRWQQAKESCSF